MILLLHIFIALTSIAVTTYGFFAPSHRLLNVSHILIALTLMSGTALVLASPAHMIQACGSGLVYVTCVALGTWTTRAKLSLDS